MTMGEDKASFWTDIKQYEEILERDPDSYAFIPLSDLYRKLGLLDDALAAAQRGISRHPTLVAGQLALGLACYEKGMEGESRAALENVVRITPENIQAQRILSQIYSETGEYAAAESALRIILALAPKDLESRIIQESIARAKGVPEAESAGIASKEDAFDISGADSFEEFPTESEQLPIGEELVSFTEQAPSTEIESVESDEEEIYELTDDCIIEELEAVAEDEWATDQDESDTGKAPLVSATMAELYVKQGFIDLAIGVYRQLVAQNPMDTELLVRLDELLTIERSRIAVSPAEISVPPFVEAGPFPESNAAVIRGDDFHAGAVPRRQNLVATLEGWLASIRRMKECRSK